MSTTETTETTAPVKELHRSRDERILAGVAGGLGRYFDLSPTFFRIGFVILTLFGGAGILLYAAAALVIPDEGRSDSIVSESLRRHRDRPWLLAGVALVGIAVLSLIAQADFWPDSGFAWILLLLGALAIAIAQRGGGSNDDAVAVVAAGDAETVVARPPRRPSLFFPVFGSLLAGAGLLALLGMFGVDIRWDVALAVGAIATGVAVVAGALTRRRTGGLAVVGVLLAAARRRGFRDRRPARRPGRRTRVSAARRKRRPTRLRRGDRRSHGRPREHCTPKRRDRGRRERRDRRADGDRSGRCGGRGRRVRLCR